MDIEVVPGIEISADYGKSEIHLLGYFLNYTDDYFCKRLELLRKGRVERVYKIVEKLKNIGVNIEVQDVFDVVGNGAPGRLHVAEVVWLTGYSKNIFDSFHKYLGYGKPAYEKKQNLSYCDAIELIISAGGVPVLAHPYKMNKDSIILELIESGLQGIEVYYPTQEPSLRLKYRNLAKRFGLAITGGSDFHGTRRPGIRLGEITINQELVKNLKKQSVLI